MPLPGASSAGSTSSAVTDEDESCMTAGSTDYYGNFSTGKQLDSTPLLDVLGYVVQHGSPSEIFFSSNRDEINRRIPDIRNYFTRLFLIFLVLLKQQFPAFFPVKGHGN